MDCLLSNVWHAYLLRLLVVILFMKNYIHFWEEGRWGNNRQNYFCHTLINIFAVQLHSPALLFILCGTFNIFLEKEF